VVSYDVLAWIASQSTLVIALVVFAWSHG